MQINKIYNCDCLQGMQSIPEGAVDLIVCDPPYGTIKGLGKNTDFASVRSDWDVVIPTDQLFAQFGRVLRQNGTLVLFSAEPYTSHLRTFKGGDNLVFTYPMIWQKLTTGNPLKSKIAPLSFFEDISVWRKREQRTSEDHPLRDYSKKLCNFIGKDAYAIIRDFQEKGYDKPTRVQHFLAFNCLQFHLCTAETYDMLTRDYRLKNWPGFLPFDELEEIDNEFQRQQETKQATFNIPNGNTYISNVLTVKKDVDTFHPTQKPIDLIAYLVDIFSNQGDLVLDACMGSGTTAIACIKEGRNFIGYELDPEFYQQACKRIEDAKRQTKLFL